MNFVVVLVVGDDYQEALAPFTAETEADERSPQYRYVVTGPDMDHLLSVCAREGIDLDALDDGSLSALLADCFQAESGHRDGTDLVYMSHENPNAQFDYSWPHKPGRLALKVPQKRAFGLLKSKTMTWRAQAKDVDVDAILEWEAAGPEHLNLQAVVVGHQWVNCFDDRARTLRPILAALDPKTWLTLVACH